MLAALERFGLLEDFLAMIHAIYDSNSFFISDSGQDSATKYQSAGISQKCPLSLFLFVIVMSVIITDARAALRESVGDVSSEVTEVLYADNTLTVDEHSELAHICTDIIANQSNHYGFVFNWSKLEDMCIGSSPSFVQLDGSLVECVTSMTYLGGLLSKDAI